jgi:hypothetical protein
VTDLNDAAVSVRPLRRLLVLREASFGTRQIVTHLISFLTLVLSAGGLFLACATSASPSQGDVATSAIVVTSWKNALKAFDDAERYANWREAALADTNTQPQLGRIQANLRDEGLREERAVGQDAVLSVRVESMSANGAAVVACVNGGEIIVNSAGQPVRGVLGESGIEEFRATMMRTSSGWKIQRQAVTEGTCRNM